MNIGNELLSRVISQALYPEDSLLAVSTGLAVSVLTGFEWFLPNAQLLNLQYSTFTYYKNEVASGCVKKQNSVSISAIKKIDDLSTYIPSIALNTLFIKTIKSYASAGGLFSMVTPVGIISHLALQTLDLSFEGTTPRFNFEFIQLNVSDTLQKSKLGIREALCL